MSTERPHRHPTLDWRVIGPALAAFLAITYIACVVFDLLFPSQAMYKAWIRLLPGFTWLGWTSFWLGLIETIVYGFYIAWVFCPLYNLFSRLTHRRLANR